MTTPSTDFDFLINLIIPKIAKNDATFRKPIGEQERLATTLKYLATGESFTSLQYLIRITKQVISNIMPEICVVIIDVLKYNIQDKNVILRLNLYKL